MAQTATLKDSTNRLLSVDAFRALTMLCMIFINDLSGVKGMPGWMDHAKELEDGMGFADTIFPAFLFIVGLSIPLAIGRKLKKGESFNAIAFSIISRSFALIVMGFFHVNLENYSPDAILPYPVWEILITVSFFLIWLDYPKTLSKAAQYALIGTGWAILILMVFLYVGGDKGHPEGMRPEWWGILGIIGWAYLLCSGIFLVFKGKLPVLFAALAVFMAINIIEDGARLHLHLWVINDGSSATLVTAGIIVSLWYAQMVAKGLNRNTWILLAVTGVLAIIAGLLIRPYTGGISKIRSTPAWVYICAGISILVFELMIWLVDVKGKKSWFKFIWPAGTSTLTCYLIPYLMVAFFSLVRFRYPRFMSNGAGGFLRSWAVAFVVVFIGGFLEKRKLRLKI